MKRKIRSTRSQRRKSPSSPPESRASRPNSSHFRKGNTVGKATRFRKGQSGNPSGRPRSAEVSKASREFLAEPVTLEELVSNKLPREWVGLSHAEVIVRTHGQSALAGSLSAAQELADRAEGKPGTALRIETGPDPLGELVRSVHEISRQIGPPIGDSEEDM